jgi:long-chain acyl-CoA synthetase
VVSVPDARSGEAAKAFIRLKRTAEHKPDAMQMRQFLSDYLGRIELPKHIEFVEDELPKTAVGKPDWRELQEQERMKTLEISVDMRSSDLDMEQAS